MVSLLELIFQGFAEWLYSLILEIWNFFFSSLLDIMTLDFVYIETHVPIVVDIEQVFLAVGWALLLGNLVFQAIRSMVSGLGFEGEDPKLLFARTFVFSFLLLASPQICEIGLNLTSRIMDLLEIPDAIDVHLVDSGVFGTLTAAWLLVIIFDIIIMFKVLKLLLEVAERYVILAVLTITAPLAFSMGGSKSTAEIFTGWCRMFGSMCLLMVTNVMFFKMLLSVVSTVPSGLDVFPWMVLIITIVKVAKKADEIITRIGLNPAITGDRGRGFGGVLAYTVLRSATSKVVHTLGAAATGGASAAAGAAVGGVKATAGAAGAAGTAGAASVAGMAAGAAGASSRASGQKAQEQTGQASPQSGVRDMAGGFSSQDGSSRRTSVPPGTRRADSHISSGSTERPASGSESGRARGGFGGGAGRAGGFADGAGHTGTKYPGRNTSGRMRPVTVYADDFDDGYEDKSKSRIDGSAGAGAPTPAGTTTAGVGKGGRTGPAGIVSPSGVTAGGAGRSSSIGPARTATSAETTGSKRTGSRRSQTSIRGSSTKETTESRSTRRDTSTAARAAASRPGPAGTGDRTTGQGTSSQKRQGSSSVRQEQRTVSSSVETSVKKSGGLGVHRGPAGSEGGVGSETGPRSKRRGSAPVRQESGSLSPTSGTAVKSGGSIAPPGTAGTGSTGWSRDRSPSPARREGIAQRSGAPAIHPGITGTGGATSAQTTSTAKQRSSSPARQEEAGKAPTPAGGPTRGGGPVARPGSAGTGGSTSAKEDTKSKRRSSSPVQQEQRKGPASPGQPLKSSGSIARPGPAGTVKGQAEQTRTTRMPPGAPGTGGPEHGKPRR